MAKKKPQTRQACVTRIFWSNAKMGVSGELFEEEVVNTAIEERNFTRVRVCSHERHDECAEDKRCGWMEPQCDEDYRRHTTLSMAAWRRLSWKKTAVIKRKVEAKVRAGFRKCRKVLMVIANVEEEG